MTTINSSKLVRNDDGESVLIPDKPILWLDDPLPRGQHLFLVEITPGKKTGINYRFIKARKFKA